ncbi:hypothetical protein U0035_05730 [Niabella yanshanensis]|uniref:Right handed beta helix domain-containing protein n=1 Tax=Niabella yanshanensis TaxID=577386 RepID=A0ABZ0WBU2_9BACT|nr:hypothetical protein [Niabella yanshanensis]WQD39645.1 hypothetical protein U0035_05730 [Niabella yanshanensis]
MIKLFLSPLKYFSIFICATALVQFYSSCTKATPLYTGGDTTTTPPKDTTTTTPPKDTTTTPPKDTTIKGRSFQVGSGSGNLTIDGSNLVINGSNIVLTNGDIVKIKGGSYTSITIRNVNVPTNGARVTFINDGLITLAGTRQMNLSNLNNVTVSGAGSSQNDRGLVFTNNSFRAVVLSGSVNNFTLQNVLFKNIADYVITYNGLDNLIYNGSPNSYVSNLAFKNIDAENVAPLIQLNGDITASGYKGLINGLEISNMTCINSPGLGAVVYAGCVINFNIHDNYVNNINTTNDNHNGVFFIHGNGKFYNNRVTNHQGNALRAWIFSAGEFANNNTVTIYNNIVHNSRKYSAFEIQVLDYMRRSSVFKAANTIVYNNTVGKLNTDKMTFPGRLIDVYNTFGTLSVYNNLVFNNNDSQILNNMSSTTIVRNENNVYIANEQEAVVMSTFASKIAGVGAN